MELNPRTQATRVVPRREDHVQHILTSGPQLRTLAAPVGVFSRGTTRISGIFRCTAWSTSTTVKPVSALLSCHQLHTLSLTF